MQYVRLKLTKSWWEDGQERKDLDPSYIELNFVNPDKWILGEDGYYYYQLPLGCRPNGRKPYRILFAAKSLGYERLYGA